MPKAVSRDEPLLLPWSSAPLFLLLYLCLGLRRNASVNPTYYGIGLLSCFVLWYCCLAQVPGTL
jgi:hypothetical protein